MKVLGLKLVKKECEDLNIPFYLLNNSPQDLAKIVTENQIGAIVCDFYPLRYPKNLVDTVLGLLPKNVSVIQVSIFD